MNPDALRSRLTALRRRARLFPPPQFQWFFRELRGREFRLLDIGCGNHAAARAKSWFPRCRYFGVDRAPYNNDAGDFRLMERYFEIDLARQSLAPVPDGYFDVAVLNHVIEHLPNGEDVLKQAAAKLRPGGRLYVEFPSVRSLRLPRMRGTLNFHDDPTHVRVYELPEVERALAAAGMHVVRSGPRRQWVNVLLFPLLLPMAWLQGYPAAAFWDVLGFADFIYSVKEVG